MSNAYHALKRRAQALMIKHWHSLSLPDYYPSLLRLLPHPFMGLGKFMVGHLHQMRSQKSYLAAHLSRVKADDSPLWPLCGHEPETFCHATLRCPVRASARARHLSGVSPSRPRRSPFVLVLPPPLTGSFHKGHGYSLPTGHAHLSPFLSCLYRFSVLPCWPHSCGSACLTSPLSSLVFVL